MTTVVVILDDSGVYQSAFCDSEIAFKVLKRGTDDAEIDKVEAGLEEITE